MVQILDAQGCLEPGGDNEIIFEIQGEVKLIGFDSGDPASHEDFESNQRRREA